MGLRWLPRMLPRPATHHTPPEYDEAMTVMPAIAARARESRRGAGTGRLPTDGFARVPPRARTHRAHESTLPVSDVADLTHAPRAAGDQPVTEARAVPGFAHASEAELARILDFYAVAWD